MHADIRWSPPADRKAGKTILQSTLATLTWILVLGLSGVEAVVNCAGTLQNAPGESTTAVHHSGAANLFKACAAMGVRKVIHFSAMGVDRETPSEFSRSKLAGDQSSCSATWTGSSCALRCDRTISLRSECPDTWAGALSRSSRSCPKRGRLQVVWLEDVVATVEHASRPIGRPAGHRVAGLTVTHSKSWSRVFAHGCAGRAVRSSGCPCRLARPDLFGAAIGLRCWVGARPCAATRKRKWYAARYRATRPARCPSTRQMCSRRADQRTRVCAGKMVCHALLPQAAGLWRSCPFWLSTAFVSLGPGWGYGIG